MYEYELPKVIGYDNEGMPILLVGEAYREYLATLNFSDEGPSLKSLAERFDREAGE